MKKLLNIEYAAVNGGYWMVYGVVCSFSSVFLLGKGYSNADIGIILAVGSVAAVFMQPLLADMADGNSGCYHSRIDGSDFCCCESFSRVDRYFRNDGSVGDSTAAADQFAGVQIVGERT